MAPSHVELVKRNEAYATNHKPLPLIAEIEATGAPPPKTCIVSCVDPRVFPEQFLDLKVGEAFVFRTIAGHPQPVVEQIISLDRVSKGFEDLILVYHTDCGATRWTDSWVHAELSKDYPSAGTEIEKLKSGAIPTSIEQNLRDDIKWLREHPLLRKELAQAIKGYMYDIKSGKVERVE